MTHIRGFRDPHAGRDPEFKKPWSNQLREVTEKLLDSQKLKYQRYLFSVVSTAPEAYVSHFDIVPNQYGLFAFSKLNHDASSEINNSAKQCIRITSRHMQ